MQLVPNMVALMTEEQIDQQIPEQLKEEAWQRVYDENGVLLRYEPRTWREMTQDENFLEWFGASIHIEGAKLNGVVLGDRHVVKGRIKMTNNIFVLEGLKIISPTQFEQFLVENQI